MRLSRRPAGRTIRAVAVAAAMATWMWPAAGPVVAEPAKRSSILDAGPATRAMQADDAANPGFLWVQQGEALWADPAVNGRACLSCHGPADPAMTGVAARYPRHDPALGRPITLDEQIRQCRVERQGVPRADPTLASDSDAQLALNAYVGLHARGQPIAVDADGPARPFLERGRSIFETRMGQLNLSCAQCHDGLAGQRLAGIIIPQGHPNGYPQYRLEWQTMGSLHRRIRNCMTGVRAEPFPPDADDLRALELFLGWRANGLAVETPAVRP